MKIKQKQQVYAYRVSSSKEKTSWPRQPWPCVCSFFTAFLEFVAWSSSCQGSRSFCSTWSRCHLSSRSCPELVGWLEACWRFVRVFMFSLAARQPCFFLSQACPGLVILLFLRFPVYSCCWNSSGPGPMLGQYYITLSTSFCLISRLLCFVYLDFCFCLGFRFPDLRVLCQLSSAQTLACANFLDC